MSGNGGEPKFDLWHYKPNLAANALLGCLFLICLIGHLWRMVRTRSWLFVPFNIGCAMEVIGYFGRIWARSNDDALGPYIMQTLMLLVAPAFFAASIYMILGRLIRLVDAEHLSLIRTTRLTKVFVGADILCFVVQGGGGGLMASNDPDKRNLGKWVVLAGLFIQIFAFGLFIVVSVLFNVRINRKPTETSLDESLPWKIHLQVLYFTSALIMIRSIFRVVEFAQGHDGYIMRTEWMILIIDGALMVLVVMVTVLWHAGEVFMRERGRDAYDMPLNSRHSGTDGELPGDYPHQGVRRGRK
ncbi:RTA1-domain-containing protein [Patellaria atrata CBS 101060]|uniref:RTA1-domain-containing protein n=1 Tax=Patellaria atrata CBS 101060 TaxID=1346257 RepID=A0A9P4VMR9_9PEZI|nr:RTA1-domain-containing protein [Patellaria atrata CBS 101060]